MRRAALVLLLGVLLPSAARAESIGLMARTGGTGVSVEARTEAEAALRRVLENDGFTVFRAEDLPVDAPPRLSSCGPDDRCGYALRRVLGVDLVVGMRLHGTEQMGIQRVTVIAIGDRHVGQRAVADVTDDRPLPFAVADAARAALSLSRQPPPSFDEPERALGPPPATTWEASPANWVLGGLVILGSAPLLGYGINTLAREGDCVTEGPGGTCTERVRFQEGAAIFTALGAAVFSAGVTILIARPLRVTVQASHEHAGLQLGGRF